MLLLAFILISSRQKKVSDEVNRIWSNIPQDSVDLENLSLKLFTFQDSRASQSLTAPQVELAKVRQEAGNILGKSSITIHFDCTIPQLTLEESLCMLK